MNLIFEEELENSGTHKSPNEPHSETWFVSGYYYYYYVFREAFMFDIMI